MHALEITKPALLELFPGSPELIETFEAVFAIRQEMLEQMIGNAARASKSGFVGRGAHTLASHRSDLAIRKREFGAERDKGAGENTAHPRQHPRT